MTRPLDHSMRGFLLQSMTGLGRDRLDHGQFADLTDHGSFVTVVQGMATTMALLRLEPGGRTDLLGRTQSPFGPGGVVAARPTTSTRRCSRSPTPGREFGRGQPEHV